MSLRQRMLRPRRRSAVEVLALLAVLVPAAVRAQVGALGAAAASGVVDENAHEGAPILGESGLLLPRGGWAASGYGALTSGGSDAGEVDFTFFQSLLGVVFAPVDKLNLGVLLLPVNSVDVDVGQQSDSDSGFGDLALYGKYLLNVSEDGRTQLAAIAQVGLPTGGSGEVFQIPVRFGSEGVVLSGGLGVSHRLEGGSLHASGGLVLPTDDADGDAYFDFSASGVLGVADRVGLSGELLGQIGDESLLNAGPGVRIRAGERVFVDGALLFNVASSLDDSPFDYGLVFGVTFGG